MGNTSITASNQIMEEMKKAKDTNDMTSRPKAPRMIQRQTYGLITTLSVYK